MNINYSICTFQAKVLNYSIKQIHQNSVLETLSRVTVIWTLCLVFLSFLGLNSLSIRVGSFSRYLKSTNSLVNFKTDLWHPTVVFMQDHGKLNMNQPFQFISLTLQTENYLFLTVGFRGCKVLAKHASLTWIEICLKEFRNDSLFSRHLGTNKFYQCRP